MSYCNPKVDRKRFICIFLIGASFSTSPSAVERQLRSSVVAAPDIVSAFRAVIGHSIAIKRGSLWLISSTRTIMSISSFIDNGPAEGSGITVFRAVYQRLPSSIPERDRTQHRYRLSPADQPTDKNIAQRHLSARRWRRNWFSNVSCWGRAQFLRSTFPREGRRCSHSGVGVMHSRHKYERRLRAKMPRSRKVGGDQGTGCASTEITNTCCSPRSSRAEWCSTRTTTTVVCKT